MAWGVLGGFLYVVGAVCDAARWPTPWPGVIGPHEIQHLFTMGGTFAHVFFILRYVLPLRP
jgi:hemolysin III